MATNKNPSKITFSFNYINVFPLGTTPLFSYNVAALKYYIFVVDRMKVRRISWNVIDEKR